MHPILVRRLRVESVSDSTPDPYGQPGFSALTAYVDTDDPSLLHQLRRVAEEGSLVVIKCATLEVEGRVAQLQFTANADAGSIAISVDDLRYFKPSSNLVVEHRNLD